MADCTLCGGVLSDCGDVLEALGVPALPRWLEGLCRRCLWGVASSVPYLDESPYPALRPVTIADLNEWATKRLRDVAWQAQNGRPAFRCDVISGGLYDQCERFASRQIGEFWVCGHCARAYAKGREMSFVRTGQRARVAVVVWARSRDEAIERAGAEWDRMETCQ